MSIAISFSMESGGSWVGGGCRSLEQAADGARRLAGELGYHCDVIERNIIFQLCPEGFLWMAWRDRGLVGECQTNIAGPGFHAAVVYFLELFAAREHMRLEIDDPTGFYLDRDFERMRREYFYPWFRQLIGEILEGRDQEQVEQQLVCWPSDYYLPEEKKNTVITHIRRFSVAEICGIAHSGLTSSFARDFFIWNEEEKDAYYYRNCALVMLNQECYFMPSKRSAEDRTINGEILKLLEYALRLNPNIPFPGQEYLELCRLDEREPADISGTSLLAEGVDQGCRRGLLYRTIGCMRFAVPGHFLYDARYQGNADRYYDGLETGWHEYYICAVQTGKAAAFQESPFGRDNVLEVIEFQAGESRGKLAVYGPAKRDGKTVYAVSAQIIYKKQITMISIRYDDPQERQWAIDLIEKVQTIEEKPTAE